MIIYLKKNIHNIYIMTSCDKTSNNKYFDCPARMDDGRAFTDYRSSSTVNDMIRYSNNTMTSFDYRQFLTNNATKIMEVNNVYTKEKVGCDSCNYVEIPFQNTCTWNSSYGSCAMTNPNGIGMDNRVMSKNIERFTPNGMNLQGYNINGQSSLTSQLAYDATAQNVYAPEAFQSNIVGAEGAFKEFSQNVYAPEPFMTKKPSQYVNAETAFNEFSQNVYVPEAFSGRR